MSVTAVEVVQQAYHAFGRGDVPAVLDLVAEEVVTVLGWERTAARPGGKVFETEWVHVFTVRGGKIVRFWGIYDTEASAAARG